MKFPESFNLQDVNWKKEVRRASRNGNTTEILNISALLIMELPGGVP